MGCHWLWITKGFQKSHLHLSVQREIGFVAVDLVLNTPWYPDE